MKITNINHWWYFFIYFMTKYFGSLFLKKGFIIILTYEGTHIFICHTHTHTHTHIQTYIRVYVYVYTDGNKIKFHYEGLWCYHSWGWGTGNAGTLRRRLLTWPYP